MQHDDGRFSKYFNKTLVDTQANGSDADSEGSDCELVPKENNTSDDKATATVIAATAIATSTITAIATMETVADFNGNPNLEISKMTLVTNRNNMQQPMNGSGAGTDGTSLPNTPLKKSTPIKRLPRRPESSKFNRSVVKSKNCATYYFKHMDTDPDSAPTTDWSQDASDVYSEEEHWIYSNGNDEVDGVDGARIHDDELNENHISVNMAQLSMQVNCNESILIDAVNGNKTDQVFAPFFFVVVVILV